MLKIRLQRVGRKNDPSFRVVVTDSRRGPKSTNYVEMLGSHNPKTDITALKSERIKHWVEHGAQVSGTVHNLLIQHNVIEGKKINVLPKKNPVVKEKTADKAAEPKMEDKVEEESNPPSDQTGGGVEEQKDDSNEENKESSPKEEEVKADEDKKDAEGGEKKTS